MSIANADATEYGQGVAPISGEGDDSGLNDNSFSVIDRHSNFDGTFRSSRDLRIEGEVKGTIECQGTLFVAQGANVSATVEAENIAVAGNPYHAIGLGKVYAAFTIDTEPHVHLAFGAKRTSPFPDRTRAIGGGNLRSAPKLADSYIVRALKDGELFTAFQVTDAGAQYHGSRRWYGDHTGQRWVHSSRLTNTGGST